MSLSDASPLVTYPAALNLNSKQSLLRGGSNEVSQVHCRFSIRRFYLAVQRISREQG
jgi:hypothetical protein